MTQTVLTCSRLDALDESAKKILDFAGDIKLFTFVGELGAGKTTLIQHICKILGIKDVVSSPTFSIIHQYHGKESVYHIDFYRINKPSELADLGIEEILDSGDKCFIEWPEIGEVFYQRELLRIVFKVFPGEKRVLELSKEKQFENKIMKKS